MINFAHLGDVHLQAAPYGLEERRLDFYENFIDNIKCIVNKEPDFLLIPGDIWTTSDPSSASLLVFQEGLNY
jgi:DNA repair exonuclease SbcCD nuclease subunit